MKHVIGLNLILGGWLLLLPFAFGYLTVAMWNDVVLGLMIITCSWCAVREIPGQTLWAICAILCGAWLLLAPFMLKYGAEAFGDVTIGALVIGISAIETWQMTAQTNERRVTWPRNGSSTARH